MVRRKKSEYQPANWLSNRHIHFSQFVDACVDGHVQSCNSLQVRNKEALNTLSKESLPSWHHQTSLCPLRWVHQPWLQVGWWGDGQGLFRVNKWLRDEAWLPFFLCSEGPLSKLLLTMYLSWLKWLIKLTKILGGYILHCGNTCSLRNCQVCNRKKVC